MTPKDITESNQAAACKAVEAINGPAETARKLTALIQEDDENAKPIRIGSVWSWMHRDRSGIPIIHILNFEKLSGLPREEIRPDVPWRGEIVDCDKMC